jgi:hypothetical protein
MRIRDLNEKLLPVSKNKRVIRKTRDDKIATFTYSLIDEKDGGIPEKD